MILPSSKAKVRQIRSKSKVHVHVPYAVGAILAISAIAVEVLAFEFNLPLLVFYLTKAHKKHATDCYHQHVYGSSFSTIGKRQYYITSQVILSAY